MTTPITQPDSITLPQLREMLKQLHAKIDALAEEIASIRDGLAQAASLPTNSNAGEFSDFMATEIVMTTDDNGEPAYKAKGGNYAKFGVRIWPEVLPSLGIDPETLKPGKNPVSLHLRAIMGDKGPRKIVGLARN